MSATCVASSSATPPPYAVAFTCRTRAPGQRLGELADAFERPGLDDALVVVEVLVEQRDAFEHGRFSVGVRRSGRGVRAVNLLHVVRARRVSRQVPRHPVGRRSRRGDRGAASSAPASTTSSTSRSPTAARARSTRCSRRAGGSRRTARVTGPLGDPVDAEWGVLPGGIAVIEMARASGLALVGADNDPLRATTRGTGELIAVARREGFTRGRRRGRRERDDRRRTRRGRRARLVAAGHRRHGRVRRRDRVRRRRARVRTAEGRDRGAGRRC